MSSPSKKAIVIGIDGASMEIVRNEAQWDNMPNIAKLMEKGVWKPMLGVFPTLTPPGWTSLYTGAWHGTHRVMDFNIRALGKPLTETVWGINTDLCQSEYLWNTAERAGKKPVLIKVEMSWPPTIKKGIQIEGTGPGVANHHQIAGYHLFLAGKWTSRLIGGGVDPEEVDPSTLHKGIPYDPVKLKKADPSAWANLPQSNRPCLEVPLMIKPLVRGTKNMLRGKKGIPKNLYGLIYAQGQKNYNRVRVCRTCDAEDSLTDLEQGEWSDFWVDAFEIDGEQVQGNVRMKLITLTPEADSFELFVPQIWPIEGYTYPDQIAKEIYDEVGPFIQNPARDALGLIDDDTYFEMLDYHHIQLSRIARHLTSNYEWDILFTETHASDYASHFFLGQADENSGADPATIQRCRDGLARTYASIDHWIGQLMELADKDTVIVIAADHGGTPSQYTPVSTSKVLAEAGLLTYHKNGHIDLAHTKAMVVGLVNIFINLKGREPGGIVEPEDYEKIQLEVIDALLDYKDKQTGLRPFALAVTRSNAEILNQWSDLVGDVVFATNPYFDHAHGRHLPLGSFGIGGQHSAFIMAGAGIKKGVTLQRQVRVVDVAPTLCHLLGWPMLKNVEGGVIYEALEDPDWYLNHR